MTERLRLADLPTWPRLLTRDAAAAYCGVSVPLFERHVKVPAVWIGGRKLFDKRDLDRWIDDRGAPEHRSDSDFLEALDGDQGARA